MHISIKRKYHCGKDKKIIINTLIKGMKKTRLMFVAAIGVALASCSGSGDSSSAPEEFPVRTVEGQNVDMQTTYPATIKGVQDVEIRPKISGFITEMCVNEGDVVKAGQRLFVIDNVTYEAAVRQTQAAVNAAQSALSTSKLTYENNQKLFENNVIGTYELESSKNAYESAQAALLQAEANYKAAKQDLDFCYITSPSDGIVGDLPYKVGALVSSTSSEPLTTVSKTSTVQVYFSMTEKDLLTMTRSAGGLHAAIKDYPAVKLQLADGTMYDLEGHVAAVSGVVDQATGSISLRADFANPQQLLKSGASGSIVVPYVKENAVFIPQDAVTQVQDQYFVYIVGDDNKVKYTAITVDPQNDGLNYIVTSGLEIGDRFVVKGTTTLSDGMEITPITEEQYAQKLSDTAAKGEAQGDLGELKEVLSE